MQDSLKIFETFHPNSKVWIFPINRKLTQMEENLATNFLNAIIQKWESHGANVKGAFALLDGCVLVLAADYSTENPSGCSIDAITRNVQQLGDDLNANFFNRLEFYFLEKENIKIISKSEVLNLFNAGVITENSLVLNSQIDRVQNLKDLFQPFRMNWYGNKLFSANKVM